MSFFLYSVREYENLPHSYFQNLPKCLGYREPTTKAAKMLAHLDNPVYIGEVNMGTSFNVVERYNATEYPEYINVYSFGRDPEKLKFPISDMSHLFFLVYKIDRLQKLQ